MIIIFVKFIVVINSFHRTTKIMTETHEYISLRAHVPQLRLAVQHHLVSLSGHLFAKEIITDEQETELRNESKDKANRAADLVSMVMNKVKLDVTKFQVFIDILKSNGVPNIDDLLTEIRLEPKVEPVSEQEVSEVIESVAISSGTQTFSNQMQHTLGIECDCRICTSELKCSSTVVNFSLLDSDPERQKKDFEFQLKRDTRDIMMQFHGVESGLYNTVCGNIPVESLKFHLNAFKASQSEQFDESIFSDYEEQIHAATNSHIIFGIVCKFWSFLDYELLKHLIEYVGNEDDKKRMVEYRVNFDQYAKRRIIECPNIKPNTDDKWENMHIKLDSKLENVTINELREFRFKVSEILGVFVSAIRFCCVKQGCIEVMWQVPSFINKIIIPLSPEKERMLELLGVIQFSCFDYEYLAPVSVY